MFNRSLKSAAGVLVACIGTAASAHIVPFYIQMDGDQVVPPTPSLATGVGLLMYNEHALEFELDLTITGIALEDLVGGGPNNTPCQILFGKFGENGDYAIDPTYWADFEQVGDKLHLYMDRITLGGFQGAFGSDVGACDEALWNEELYIIVRTAAFPDGEIRGQILGNCRADVNDDGFVDTLDVISFLALFNDQHPDADFDGNGFINTLDFIDFLNSFNLGC